MAANVHVANIGLVLVDPIGNVITRNDTIGKVINTSTVHRVLPDTTNANTAGYPTLEEYLQLEYDAGFATLAHLDQYTVVTYGTGS